jgi:hypothetical protein
MSGQIQSGPTRYLGIINGIVYRIDSTVSPAGPAFGLVPLEIEPLPVGEGLATTEPMPPPPARPARRRSGHMSVAAAETSATPPGTDDDARARKAEIAAALFPRDGAEPLRAGHPDLWNLLVAGTCLEGSSFRSV